MTGRRERRAIVCDDDQDHFKRIESYLKEHKYAVSRAKDGTELFVALRGAQKRKAWFDLVLIDLDLSLSGELGTGADLYFRVSRDYPDENYVVYTTQDQDTYRRAIGDLSVRRVPVVLLDADLGWGTLERGLFLVVDRPDPNRVFLVHGRDSGKKRQIELLLRDGFGLRVVTLEEARQELAGPPTDSIFAVVAKGIQVSHATVILFTEDESVRLRPSLRGGKYAQDETARYQSRANVYIEVGYAFALRAGRTILLEWPRRGRKVSQPSDIGGLHFLRFDGGKGSREALRDRLVTARCDVEPRPGWRTMDLTPSPTR